MYNAKMGQLGADMEERASTARMKERILAYLPIVHSPQDCIYPVRLEMEP